mmetsp:Transcript_25837/g.44132  ORF Transcript_25837/g.44132 Transcript_25837/m.44132 type:complete len:226 (-) Transcript_25837:445-1122(-)
MYATLLIQTLLITDMINTANYPVSCQILVMADVTIIKITFVIERTKDAFPIGTVNANATMIHILVTRLEPGCRIIVTVRTLGIYVGKNSFNLERGTQTIWHAGTMQAIQKPWNTSSHMPALCGRNVRGGSMTTFLQMLRPVALMMESWSIMVGQNAQSKWMTSSRLRMPLLSSYQPYHILEIMNGLFVIWTKSTLSPGLTKISMLCIIRAGVLNLLLSWNSIRAG